MHHLLGFFGIRHIAAARYGQADVLHHLFEHFAVFGFSDRLQLRPDQLDAEFFQHAVFGQGDRQIQSRLTAHRRQQRLWPLTAQNAFQHLRRQGLDIGPIRHVGIGHDRRGITVDQNNRVAFFLQGLTGLSARVVKFASLTNYNRAQTNEEYLLSISDVWAITPLPFTYRINGQMHEHRAAREASG